MKKIRIRDIMSKVRKTWHRKPQTQVVQSDKLYDRKRRKQEDRRILKEES